MNDWEIRQALRDMDMRRALLKFLQEATPSEYPTGSTTRPEPMRDDDQVKDELHRILGIRKGLFR